MKKRMQTISKKKGGRETASESDELRKIGAVENAMLWGITGKETPGQENWPCGKATAYGNALADLPKNPEGRDPEKMRLKGGGANSIAEQMSIGN